MSRKTLIIGGGAAGMTAAVAAAECGDDVTILEKNEKLGKKIFITGKGRCNVTNACDKDVFFEHVVSNPKFLYSAYMAFDNKALTELIHQYQQSLIACCRIDLLLTYLSLISNLL